MLLKQLARRWQTRRYRMPVSTVPGACRCDCMVSTAARMSNVLSARLEYLQHEVQKPSQVLERFVVKQPLTICLVAQLRVAVTTNLREPNDLVVAEPHDGIVHA